MAVCVVLKKERLEFFICFLLAAALEPDAFDFIVSGIIPIILSVLTRHLNHEIFRDFINRHEYKTVISIIRR